MLTWELCIREGRKERWLRSLLGNGIFKFGHTNNIQYLLRAANQNEYGLNPSLGLYKVI